MANFFVGLFLLLVLLFFWSLTFWRIVLWFALGSFWVYAFGYALSLMFNDSSATPYVWGAILGVPLYCVGTFFWWISREPEPRSGIYDSGYYPLHRL